MNKHAVPSWNATDYSIQYLAQKTGFVNIAGTNIYPR